MSKFTSQHSWQFLTEDVDEILEGLRQTEFDHIYPANPTMFDRFLAYLGEAGVRETPDQFPDSRACRLPGATCPHADSSPAARSPAAPSSLPSRARRNSGYESLRPGDLHNSACTWGYLIASGPLGSWTHTLHGATPSRARYLACGHFK